jgi:hypothetical protein
MKAAFGTVLYKESFKFFKEFAESLNNQDCYDFDVLLLNDNLNNEELEKVTSYLKKNVILLYGKQNSSIPELRFQLISSAKENGYDLLILGDFDDTFSRNRVSNIISEYDKKISFYYNNLYYYEKQRKFFNYLPLYTTKITDIIEHNYLGLSNTALNLNNINYVLINELNEKTAVVFDWYMYSILLKRGHIGKKVEGCKTYYRIYENNTAGECKNTIEDIYKEIIVKMNHYNILKKFDSKFDELFDFYKELQFDINNGRIDIMSYVDKYNDYWWGRIKSNKIKLERKN